MNRLKRTKSREKHIQKKIEAQLLDAKAKSAAKDKKGALFALKKKKMYEGEIDKLNGARMTLESQVFRNEHRGAGWNSDRRESAGASCPHSPRKFHSKASMRT